MTESLSLYQQVRLAPTYEQLMEIIKEPSKHLRYSVTRGSLLNDVWKIAFKAGQDDDGLTLHALGKCAAATSYLLGFNHKSNLADNLRNFLAPDVGEKQKTSLTKVSNAQATIGSLVMRLSRGNLPCGHEKCQPNINVWNSLAAIERNTQGCNQKCKDYAAIAAKAIEFLGAEPLSKGRIWTGEPLGVDASTMIEYLVAGRKHFIIPVEPKSVANWADKDFLATFGHLEGYLRAASSEGLRLIYILEPAPENPEDVETWLRGEYRYRRAMEHLIRRGLLKDLNTIHWLVRDDQRRDDIAEELFPTPKEKSRKWRSWEADLRAKFENLGSWTYSACVGKSQSNPEKVEFFLTPIARKIRAKGNEVDLIQRYRQPAVPVESACQDKLPKTLVRCVNAITSKSAEELDAWEKKTGWRSANVLEFLALPAVRNTPVRTQFGE